MNLLQYLPIVVDYLHTVYLDCVPDWDGEDNFNVNPLTQGEYNINYTVQKGHKTWVFRVNIGTQIQRDDQIMYEYKTLQLLENSGNFIANREQNILYLVDWEKLLYGDPSQDISHFCASMTTLWKTNFRMSADVKNNL